MIEVEHLSKTYGSTAAIADVSFSVESGEILGFLGPNGAGKTTTMRILSGYLPASSGTARIAGLDVHEKSMAVRQRIGYLPENPPLYPEMTVEGFLFFVARIKQVPAGDRARRVTSAIERCGLVEKRKVLIRKLSKGFKQRVGIAQAIVHDPPVIILDEPTVGLDPRQIIEVRNLIKSLAGQHTIILSTHILPEVSMTCSRVTIINRGKVVAAGSPERLMGELAADAGYELEVAGEGDLVNTLLLPSLENLPGVRSLELIQNEPSLAGRYRLRALCEPDAEPGREIAAAIVANGFGLCEMRRDRASMEDVFLRLTAAENKPEADLVRTEPEVDRNLQEVAGKQEPIAPSQTDSELVVENLSVARKQESPYDSSPEPEPIVETLEPIKLSQPEPIVETLEPIELSQPEPIVERVEPIDLSQPEPMVERVEPLELPQPEPAPIAKIAESSDEVQPEMQPVADFLQVVKKQEPLELSPPEPEPIVERLEPLELSQPEPIVERVEPIELPQPELAPIAERVESLELSQREPIVERVESLELSQPEPEPEPIVERVESIELPQPELAPIAERVESLEHSQPEPEPEPIVERVESLELSQPEPIVERGESLELSQPKAPPADKNRQLEKKQQPSSDGRSEPQPLPKQRQMRRKQQPNSDAQTEAKNRQIPKKQQPSSDSEIPPPTDTE